ncbi:MAG: HEPN domain-containing protein [Chloroflexi bacterium]|nr:HEPN domain-containing protein [Chloroflexota bacterium]
MEEAQLESVRLRMVLAEEKLVVARDLLATGHYNDVIAKAYYAMFYASKALLLAIGEDPVKHTGVITLFGKHFVKVGLTHPKYGRTLAIAKRLREECDYNERKRATEEEAKLAIADAEDFVREAQRILEKLLIRNPDDH